MIVLHLSNRMERLTDQLFSEIRGSPSLPWSSVTILPQNPTIGRWLIFRLADEQGVAMNVDTPLPGVWVRDFLVSVTGAPDNAVHFERNALFIRLLREIPLHCDHPSFSGIRRYLGEGIPSRRLASLADELSELYDRAMLYRPDVLTAWEDSPEDVSWQAILWRAMTAGEKPLHFARLVQMFRTLPVSGPLPVASLPDRLFLFGLSGIAPAMLDVFFRIGRETDCRVHVFFLNPTDRYWADMVSLRTWREMDEDLKPYFDPGHPLLASLGRTARDLHRKLEEWIRQGEENGKVEVREDFEEPGGETVLSRLQRSLFRMDAAGEFPERVREDGSLLIVSSPSVYREVETLRDFLLDRLLAQPDLRLEDIVILTPDIDLYAGAIRAVFESPGEEADAGEPVLPVTLSDRMPFEDILSEALTGLLLLPDFPLTMSFFARLLSIPEVQERFSLDRRTAVSLTEALAAAGFRWGVDKEDRTPEEPEDHTLDWAVSRILEGYCTGPETGPEGKGIFLPVRPFDLSDDPLGEKAGILFRLFDRFRFWRDRFSGRHSLSVWEELFSGLLSDFFVLDPDRHKEICGIGETLRALCRNVHDVGEIDCAMFAEILSRRIFRKDRRDRFFSGGITFGQMVPLRSIPFRVVCLLGMGEGSFPRNDFAQSFDFVRESPRLLDRSLREDDLHLFLEILLSARQTLWISHVGGEEEDGTPGLPCSPLRQLLETLREPFPPEEKGTGVFRTVPSDPFDPSRFSPRAGSLGGFSVFCADIARFRKRGEKCTPSPFLPSRGRLVLPDPPEEKGGSRRVALDRLQSFYRNPPRYQAKNVLGLAGVDDRPSLSDEEPFLLDASGETDDPARIPWPPLGPVEKERRERELLLRRTKLLGRFEGLLEDRPERHRFSVKIGRIQLYGTVSCHRETGLVVADPFPWTLRPADILQSFLGHLACSASLEFYRGTVLLDRSRDFSGAGEPDHPLFWPAEPPVAERLLRLYLVLYRRYRPRTFPFLPSVSFAYALEFRYPKKGPPDPGASRAAALKAWKKLDPWGQEHSGPSSRMKGELRKDPRRREGFYPHLFFDPEGNWISDPVFATLALRLWDPVLDRLFPDPEEAH